MAGDFTRVIVVIREHAVCLRFIIIINSDNISFLIDNISTCFIDFNYKAKTIASRMLGTMRSLPTTTILQRVDKIRTEIEVSFVISNSRLCFFKISLWYIRESLVKNERWKAATCMKMFLRKYVTVVYDRTL